MAEINNLRNDKMWSKSGRPCQLLFLPHVWAQKPENFWIDTSDYIFIMSANEKHVSDFSKRVCPRELRYNLDANKIYNDSNYMLLDIITVIVIHIFLEWMLYNYQRQVGLGHAKYHIHIMYQLLVKWLIWKFEILIRMLTSVKNAEHA